MIGRQRAQLREANERLDIVYRERDELTQALAKAQKETRDMDNTLAKVQRVLDGMSKRAAERDAALLAAKKETPPEPPAAVVQFAPLKPSIPTPKETAQQSSAPAADTPDPAIESAANQLSIALLQAAVDFSKANPGQKPTDPIQLIPYLPPEMADKLKLLMQTPPQDPPKE